MAEERERGYPPIVTLVGPTAVGKSALAMDLAGEFGMQIVSADSRQVYRYLDIGTAKPSREERAEVRHYMLDLIEPDDIYTAERFQQEGRRVLRRLGGEAGRALVVGGTGFYVRALLDGVAFPAVEPNPGLRERLLQVALEQGPEALHARLAEVDPASAARIHPNNVNRVVRALEIVDALGRPVPAAPGNQIPALYLGLTLERRTLQRAADARVLEQVRAGLVEETRLALAMGYSPEAPALQGFGYQQMVEYLGGRLTLAEAIEGYRLAQHRYIRRQMTWFRADERVHWIEQGPDAQERAREQIRTYLGDD